MKTLTLFFATLCSMGIALQSSGQCVATINGPSSICSGESVQLTVSVDTSDDDCPCNNGDINNADIVWTWNSQSTVGQGTGININNLSTTTTVSVSVSEDCLGEGNSIQDEITITVIQPPSFDIQLSNSSEALCVGNEITFELVGDFPNPVDTYDWSGVDSSNGAMATENNASEGTLNVSCEVTDEEGCSTTENASFTVTDIFISIIQSGNGTYCEGEEFTISASPNNTPDFDSCVWEVLDTGFNPNGDNCSVTVSSASASTHDGTWQVDVIDENGCSDTQSVNVQIEEAPNVSINLASNEVCSNADEVQMTVGPANGSYFMDSDCDSPNSNPIDPIDNEFDPGSSGEGSFCVCYTAESQSGCEATECAPITVFEPNQASFTSSPDATCKNGPDIDLSDFVSPLPSAGISGEFTVNDCPETTVLNPDDPCVDTGFNPIVYTFTDNNGCITTANSNIQVFQQLIATTSSDFDVCEGAEAELGVSANGGDPNTYQYAWSPSSGLSNSSSNEPVVLSASETQQYTATVTDANGCESSGSMLLSVFPQPEIISISQNPVSFCVGGTAELTIENNWSGNEWDITTGYNWIYNGNNVSGNTASNEFSSVLDTTVVSIQIAFNANGYDPGCESIFSNFTLNPVPDPAPALASNQNTICSGEEVIFTASNTTNGSAFNWDFDPQPSSFEIIGNGNVAIASWDGQTGDVDVSLIESLVSCSGADSLTVSLNNASAPVNADIAQLGNSTLVYTDSGPDCYRWGYIDAAGVIQYLVDPFTNEPETFQTVVLTEINSSYLYFCEAWYGDCNNPGCSTTSVFDGAFVNVEEDAQHSPFYVYPNPSSGTSWLNLKQAFIGSLRVEISDVLGQHVSSTTITRSHSNSIPLNLSELASDIYLLSLYDATGLIGTTRIIIHR